MANDFQFEDNSIPTRPLGSDGLELFLNEELTGAGEVRSSNKYRYGTITAKHYSTQFHRLEESHGGLTGDKPDADDASLIVLRITPQTDVSKRRFKNFTLTLTLEPANIASNDDPPSVAAFEPAADGDQYFQEHIIAITKTDTLQGTLGVKPPMTELSISPSRSTARQFNDRRLLKLTTNPRGEIAGVDTEVEFTITPAVEKDGIGDRLAVALIVKRAPGASFFIKAVTSAEVSHRIADTLEWRPHKRHENALRMGPFGPKKTGVETNPEGIDANNMMASADQGLKKLAYLHLPEEGTKKLFLEQEDKGNDVLTPSAQPPTGDTAAPDANSAASLPAIVGGGNPTAASKTKDGDASVEPIALSSSQRAVPQQSVPPRPPAQRAPHQRSPLSIQNSRAVRHRMMASLYQNLAQLHLEEAEETEALIEKANAG